MAKTVGDNVTGNRESDRITFMGFSRVSKEALVANSGPIPEGAEVRHPRRVRLYAEVALFQPYDMARRLFERLVVRKFSN